MSRLLVVSNRLPALDGQASAGGLAIGLQSALQESDGLWLGWSGDVCEDSPHGIEISDAGGFDIASISLTREEANGYYIEFANRCLWPLFHSRLDITQFDETAYRIYRHVNQKFAQAVAELAREGDQIWVHDYHHISLAGMLRRQTTGFCVGFFVHIPFPPPEIFANLPWARELAIDLLSYDLVGFQTEAYAWNFRAYLQRYMDGAVEADGRVQVDDHTAMIGVFPIGIDPTAVSDLAASPTGYETVEEIAVGSHETAVIAGVERLDYTKGIPERFEAFERFLERYPEYLGRTSLLQVAAPSRTDIPEYQAVVRKVDELVGHINGRFGSFAWIPINLIKRPLSQQRVTALYRASKVGLITPLRDGMNLVAKEYVAAQDPEDPGVLVLSQFAGAAEELDDAILVNPHDVNGTADSLRLAIEMSAADRVGRWQRMMKKLRSNDIHHWRRSFLKALESACAKVA